MNARDLHEGLGVGKDFSTWIKDRIKQCNLLENQDFVVVPEIGENPLGGRPSIEYHLTLDAAKHLAMLERNEQGDFIEGTDFCSFLSKSSGGRAKRRQ